MVDLKRLSDYENILKNTVKEEKIYYDSILSNIDDGIKTCRFLKNFSITLFILCGISFVLFSSFISFLFCAALAAIYISNKYKKNFISKKEFIEVDHEMAQKSLEDSIDSCELLKEYIRGRNLEEKDLIKIIMYLYPTFGNELDDIIHLLYDKLVKNTEHFEEKDVLSKVFENNYIITSDQNIEFIENSIFVEDDNYCRKLKR